MIKGTFLVQGFSVVQEASLMVQSFPHAPDVFALLKELAVSTGQYNVVLSPEEGPSQQGRTDLGLSASGNSQAGSKPNESQSVCISFLLLGQFHRGLTSLR